MWRSKRPTRSYASVRPTTCWTSSWHRRGRAIALRGAGTLPAAVEAGRDAVRGAEATDWIGYHTMALMALAEALLASGDPLEATQLATRALAMSVAKEDLMGERRAARFLDGIH